MASTQQEAIDWLKLNFWKVRDDALFTSLKDITNSSYYQSTAESTNYIMIANCSSLITLLGIPTGITWSWTTDQMDSAINYVITVVSPYSGTLIVGVTGGSTSVSVKSFLSALDNTVGLVNFQFRCIDQRDNSLSFRMGRFPSNFLTLFPSTSYKFEIRPIFCDNRGMIRRDHASASSILHSIRPRIMEKYGRGNDSRVTLPWHLNSVLTMNVQSDSSMPQGQNLAGMDSQIDPTVQSNYVDRGHHLLNQPYLDGGYGKAKILNDFQGDSHRENIYDSGNYSYGQVYNLIQECDCFGPKNIIWDQEMDRMFFRWYGSMSYRPYIYFLKPQTINQYTSDTPAWDSTLTTLQFDLANFCYHKRCNMNRKGPGMRGRNMGNPRNHSYSRIQYTMALIIWKYLNGHYQPFAIIADQGRFFDFEESISQTKQKKKPRVKGYSSRLIRVTVQGNSGYYFAPVGTNILDFNSTYVPSSWNNFVGIHIWTEDGLWGYLKKVSVSGNIITVKGDLKTFEQIGTSSQQYFFNQQATIDMSQWASSKRITISQVGASSTITGASIYFTL